MTDRIRVGVVGAGAIAQVAHLPVLSRLGDAEVVSICDNDLPKARALASRFKIDECYDDIEELLKYSRPEAVAIFTPNHLHEVHAVTALSAGVHVLCERPLALGVRGVQKLVAAQERAGKVVMVGMNHRFRSDVQAVRGFLKGGELGSLTAIRAGRYEFRPSQAALGWRTRRAESGGGAMLDLGLSMVDLALWLAGGPRATRVSAALNWSQGEPEIDDGGCALITCDSGLSILVDVSWRYPGGSARFWLEVSGDKGSASIAPLKVFKELHGTPMDVTPTGASGRENAFTESYRAEWARFLAAVRGEVEAPDLADQVVLHHVLDAVYQSASDGRDISL